MANFSGKGIKTGLLSGYLAEIEELTVIQPLISGKGDKVVIPALYDWRESIDRPGAIDIRHIRKLFELRDFSRLIPDQSIIYGNNPKDSTHIRAAVANDGAFLVAYLSVGQSIKVVMRKISGTKVSATWYNPREGTFSSAGEFNNTGFVTFTPPTSGIDNDWVLIIDNAASDLPELYKRNL